jgi:hypothetical protein
MLGNPYTVVEEKYIQILGISFRTIPRKRKQLKILFRGTKIEANFRNFVPKHFAEENILSILFFETGNFCCESLSGSKRSSQKCQK